MWLYVPFLYAPGSEPQTWASHHGRNLWCASSGKPSPRPCLWRGWKTRPWVAALSGLTWSDSTLRTGVARWILSLRASRAHRSLLQGTSAGPTTTATSGRSFGVPLFSLEPRSCSWRTYGALFTTPTASNGGYETLPVSGSMRSGKLYRRERSVPRRSESASSCWPTPTAGDSASTGAASYSTASGRHSGTTLTDAARKWPAARAGVHGEPGAGKGHPTVASMWDAPTAHDGRRPGADLFSTQGANLSRQATLWAAPSAINPNDTETLESWQARADGLKKKGINGNGAGMPLAVQAKKWATPTVADVTGGHANRSGNRSEELLLNGQARKWADECSPPTGRQVLTTPMAGEIGLQQEGRPRLNAQFVEMLQGLPRNWTVPIASALSATPARPNSTEPPSSCSAGG